jgi:hypothetical protein
MTDHSLVVHVHSNGGVSEGGETHQYAARSVTIDLGRRSMFVHRNPYGVEIQFEEGKHIEIDISRSLA